jgi:Ser/Thr protein kinase RdoA (MazF antagonist)
MGTGAERAAQTRWLRRVVEVALAAYDVRPVRVRRLPRGWNATFGVQAQDGSRYALRVHRPDGPDAAMVRSELSWLRAISQDTDLVVPRPHPTRDGALLTVVDDPAVVDDTGPRVCDLLGWVEGRFVDARLTPPHLRATGALTARLQEHGRRFVRPDGFVRRDVIRWTDLTDSGEDPLGAALLERAADALTALDPGWDLGIVRATVERARLARDAAREAGRTGLLHADLHQENVLFGSRTARADGAIAVGAIDFDDCGDGPDPYDLAVMMAELWGRPDRDRLRAALLEGYASVRPLPGGSDAHADEQVDAMEGLRHLQLAVYGVEHRAEPMFAPWWREDMTDIVHRLARHLG